jgi:hypothetical protein
MVRNFGPNRLCSNWKRCAQPKRANTIHDPSDGIIIQRGLSPFKLLNGLIVPLTFSALEKQPHRNGAVDDDDDDRVKNDGMKNPPEQVAKKRDNNHQPNRQNPVFTEYRQALIAMPS